MSSYANDLLHLWRFLGTRRMARTEQRPAQTLDLLEFLRSQPSGTKAQQLS